MVFGFNRITRDLVKQCLVAASWGVFFSWFDRLAALAHRPSQRAGVLLVKLDAIGDFVLASPLIAQLIRQAGQESVTIACDARNVALAQAMFTNVDIIGVNISRFLTWPVYRWQILGAVAAKGPARAINLALSHEIWWGDAIIRVCGAREREGIRGYTDRLAPWLLTLCYRWYTKTVPLSGAGGFEVNVLRTALRDLGYDVEELRTTSFQNVAKSKGPDKAYFVMAPGSLRAVKQWPPERFAEIARRLHARTGWSAVLLGAPSDIPAMNAVAVAAPDVVINLAGQTSLMEAVATIAGAKLLIANDSALVHIAAIQGVTCVATLGGGHPGRFLPYPADIDWLGPVHAVLHAMPCQGCDWRCIYPVGDVAPAPCITQIQTDSLWAEVEKAAGLT